MVVWADPIFFRHNFGGRDLVGYQLPIESAVHEAWARHRLPVWIEDISGGRPLAANPNCGALYPVRLLLSLAPFPTAMGLFPVVHWALAGLGAMALAGALGMSASAAWMAAVSYAFSGVAVGEFTYPNIHPGMALLPWVVWSVARPAGSAASRVLLPAVLLGLDLYAGDVVTVGLAVAGAGLFLVAEADRTRLARRSAELAAACVLAGLFAAPQIVATALWAPLTNRAVLGMKVGEVVAMSLSPWRLFELVIPFPFGPAWELDPSTLWGMPVFRGRVVGFFPTLYAGGLAAIGAVLVWRQRRPGARFTRLFLLLGLGLSVLPSLVPAAWEQLAAPVALRYPEKFAVAVALALALGAAMAFERVRATGPATRAGILVGAAFLCLAAGSLAWPRAAGTAAAAAIGAPERLAGVASRELPPALAEAGILWMATVVALDRLRPSPRGASTLSLALLTLIPVASNRRIALVFDDDALFRPTAFARFVERRDPGGGFRTMSYAMPPADARKLLSTDPGEIEWARRLWVLYTPALWNRGVVFNADLDHGDFSRTESLRQVFNVAALYKDSSPFFGSLSLRFGLRMRGQPPFAGYHRVGGDALQDWDEHERAFPDIRLLARWRESASATEALREIPRRGPGELVLETGRSAEGSSPGGSVRVLERAPERLVVETESTEDDWLFVLRGYWPYRQVRVDGREVESVPAHLAFSAVAVPAGRHRVEWEEQLPGFRISRWGPALFALCGLLVVLRERRIPGARPESGGAWR